MDSVDRYRRAKDVERDARARAVAEVACTAARVCDAKSACLASFDPTDRALALKDEVARALARIQSGAVAKDSVEAQALPAKLDQAERLLKEGRAKMPDCEQKIAGLRIELGV